MLFSWLYHFFIQIFNTISERNRKARFFINHFTFLKIFGCNSQGFYYQSYFLFITFFCINRKKYWCRVNFRFPVFGGFTRFGMSWTRFDYFWKMSVCVSVCLCVCVPVCVWQKFCVKCSSRTNARNFMKLYI